MEAATAETTKPARRPRKSAAKKATRAAKSPTKGPSKIAQYGVWARDEIKSKTLEKGDLAALFEKGAKKFGLAVATCRVQYSRQQIGGTKK